MKNASVPDDKATAIYHHFEALTAATNANTVDNRAAPKTILYSCCGPARLSTNRSALGGSSRESQSTILSSIPIVPSRWENWRPMSQIYALLFLRWSVPVVCDPDFTRLPTASKALADHQRSPPIPFPICRPPCKSLSRENTDLLMRARESVHNELATESAARTWPPGCGSCLRRTRHPFAVSGPKAVTED